MRDQAVLYTLKVLIPTDDDPATQIRAQNPDLTSGKVRTRTHLRTARPVSLLSTGHLVEI